jgi:hypothetical protein
MMRKDGFFFLIQMISTDDARQFILAAIGPGGEDSEWSDKDAAYHKLSLKFTGANDAGFNLWKQVLESGVLVTVHRYILTP